MLDQVELEAKREYGLLLVRNIKSVILRARKIATGTLLASINYTIGSSGRLRIIYAPEGKWVRFGRRPGARQPPTVPLEKWIRAKGIKGRDKKGRFISNASLAFAIAKGISKNGIPAFDFVALGMRETKRELKQVAKDTAIRLKKEFLTNKKR